MSESAKIYPLIKKYLHGRIVDIGCGDQKIVPQAIGVDIRKTDPIDILMDSIDRVYDLYSIGTLRHADIVFASHFLEHILSPEKFINECHLILAESGKLILYLPSAQHYDNRSNPEHFHSFEYEVFMRWFHELYKDMFEIIEHGPHYGDGCYSFYIVAMKK